MINKTSIRFFENIPVRAVWDDESSKWWFCAMDIAEAFTKFMECLGIKLSIPPLL